MAFSGTEQSSTDGDRPKKMKTRTKIGELESHNCRTRGLQQTRVKRKELLNVRAGCVVCVCVVFRREEAVGLRGIVSQNRGGRRLGSGFSCEGAGSGFRALVRAWVCAVRGPDAKRKEQGRRLRAEISGVSFMRRTSHSGNNDAASKPNRRAATTIAGEPKGKWRK